VKGGGGFCVRILQLGLKQRNLVPNLLLFARFFEQSVGGGVHRLQKRVRVI
jgi:hypothetical protein